MELLFKNKTTLSKENYMQLVHFHQEKNNWKYWLYTGIFSVLFILCIIFQVIAQNYFSACIILLALLFFWAYRLMEPYYKTKKELQSKKVQENLINYYFFYDTYFKIKNKIGTSKIKYYKIYRVYEKEDFFYLYFDKSNAFIIDKSGFTLGNKTTFSQFLKKKFPFKFKIENT